jgi:hypothetical protein
MSEYEVNEDGSIDIPVIVQESGLYGGAAPDELRIHTIAKYGEDEFNKQYVAMMNRKTDLPFYLATARVKIVSPLIQITDEMNAKEGIAPLGD